VSQPRVLILRTAGTNCDGETQYAWELAGATAERVHVGRLIEQPALLDDYQVLTLPGGFSYGDDISAGRILAAKIERHLLDRVRAFVAAGRLVIGICNGFQTLVKAGLLPGRSIACTLTYNQPPGFQDRWTWLRVTTERCVFLEPGRVFELPIAHGEGRLAFGSDHDLAATRAAGLAALCYAPPPGNATSDGPYNPTGTAADLTGLCDETGRIFGLMPHPERFVTWTQHPAWTSRPLRPAGDGLDIFKRAVAYLQ
jgi:phosphoribosylformylglycinamidine synthase subunit PurQ / glutaminase